MITIGKLYVVQINGKSRLVAETDIDGNKNEIWVEVDQKYGPYLCHERSDAFVIGILNYAMLNGHDITCTSPMGEDLYYQLTNYLIDALTRESKTLHKTVLITETDSSVLPSAQAIGTGISCGIDSLHTLSQQTNTRLKKHNITHLAFHNVGSHGVGERAKTFFSGRKALVEQFAKEYGFDFVAVNSNIMDIIPQNHFLTEIYTSTFAIYALQKLYATYYHASSYALSEFSLKESEKHAASQYELLFFYACSTKTLTLYDEGASLSRFEKTKLVTEYEPSYKYLNVCTDQIANCNRCEKCARTLLAIDALGKLDLYKQVFDINFYKKNRQSYYALMVEYYLKKDSDYIEVYHLLKGKASLSAKLKGAFRAYYTSCSVLVPDSIKNAIKKVFHFTMPSSIK